MKFWRPNTLFAHSIRERRLDQRKPATINAAICSEHDNGKRCIISSLSLTGMLLQLNEVNLPVGAALQVYFYCNVDGADKCCNELVSVVGVRNDGVAVRFERFDNEHQSNMQMMLHQICEFTAAHQNSNPISAFPIAANAASTSTQVTLKNTNTA